MPDNEQRIYFLHGPQGSGKGTRARAILGVSGGGVTRFQTREGSMFEDYGDAGVVFEGDPGPSAAKAALGHVSTVVVCSCEPPSRAWLAAVSKGSRRVVFEELPKR